MSEQKWSEARVRAMLAEQSFSYQNVELPYGLETGGNDRSHVARQVFPEDMSGKSVFDLGCRNGYFCFEAERRGAVHVVGGELDPDSLEKCELLADVLASKVKYLPFNIEQDPLPGRFDYVLCLNVLHHLRNPLSALDKLIDATRECLVLEVASLTPKDRRDSMAARLFGPILVRLPLIYVGGSGETNKSGRGYFITESALVTMLKKHRCDIAKVEILRMGEEKRGRYLAIARKRRIGHLFIVMGTNAVGKSTFVESLLRGENSDVANEMGLDLSLDWTHQRYNKLPQAETADVPHMLMQFNIGKYLIDGDLHHYERGLLDLIRVADKVTIATMWLPAETLRERFAKRVPTSWLEKRMRSRRVRKIHETFAQLYEDPEQLALRYRAWFSFARRNSSDNFVVLQDSRPNQKNSYRVVTIEDWEREQP